MTDLTIAERYLAREALQRDLEEAIGRAPRGLSDKDIEGCWQRAKKYWQPERDALRRIKENGRNKSNG